MSKERSAITDSNATAIFPIGKHTNWETGHLWINVSGEIPDDIEAFVQRAHDSLLNSKYSGELMVVDFSQDKNSVKEITDDLISEGYEAEIVTSLFSYFKEKKVKAVHLFANNSVNAALFLVEGSNQIPSSFNNPDLFVLTKKRTEF
ncbi:hypothetical protein GYA49_02100 [Candidatus Beckwithbacteria bacterium]|nr:hypothetical protein [Candidatus Beckwithbacteria bacterium]